MKNFKKLFAFFILIGVIAILASCGSASGVKGVMEAENVSTNSITIKCAFNENENLKTKKATASVKQYKVVDESTNEYMTTSQVSFSNNVYTKSEVSFSGLTKNTKYLFELYIQFNNYSDKIYTLDVTTKDSEVIEINTVEEFNKIGDDVSADYVLKADLDFTDKTLSTGLSATKSERFKGTFDGNNHKISNLTLSAATNIGLFAYTDDAEIKNLTLENVKGDYTSGRASSSIGALIGCAEKTTVENVTVNGVKFELQGNTSSEINIGGIIGKADMCTFTNVKATSVELILSRSRLKINAGLFSGVLTGKSVGTIIVNEVEQTLAADKCSASGKIEAVMYYPSSEGYSHIGGFSGDISTQSLITDCYSTGSLIITKDTTSSYSNKYDLAVGGFFGCNNLGNGVKIDKCLANCSIAVYAGNAPTSTNGTYVKYESFPTNPTDEEKAAFKADLVANIQKEYETFKDTDYSSANYSNITTIKDTAINNINNATTLGLEEGGALALYNKAQEDMNKVQKTIETSTLTTSNSTDMYYASVGGFAGALHKYIYLITNSVYKEAGNGLNVFAKDTQTITKDKVETDTQVLFVGDIVGKNYDSDTKVRNVVKWTDALDMSAFGENVKAFLNITA